MSNISNNKKKLFVCLNCGKTVVSEKCPECSSETVSIEKIAEALDKMDYMVQYCSCNVELIKKENWKSLCEYCNSWYTYGPVSSYYKLFGWFPGMKNEKLLKEVVEFIKKEG